MFFVMSYTREHGRVYQHRVGKMTTSLSKAVNKARSCQGYITTEDGDLVAQAYDKRLPRHVDEIKNIGSGEDCYA